MDTEHLRAQVIVQTWCDMASFALWPFDKLRRAKLRAVTLTPALSRRGRGGKSPLPCSLFGCVVGLGFTGAVSGLGLWSRWVRPGGPVRAFFPERRPWRLLRGAVVFGCVGRGEFLVSSW